MARFLRSNRRNSGLFLIEARAFRSSDSSLLNFIFMPLVLYFGLRRPIRDATGPARLMLLRHRLLIGQRVE